MAEISDNLKLFAMALKSQGVPDPEPEYEFAKPERKFRFDLAWPDYLVAFEREGATWAKGKSRHTTGEGYHRDLVKYNMASIRGWCLIRASADMIKNGSAMKILLEALKSRGWEG